MSMITKSRRRQLRYKIANDQIACVEFEYPPPNGQQHRLPLTNLSASGVSFVLGEPGDLALEEGANLDGAIVRVGDCMIRGDLVVMHVTAGPDGKIVCGALLYPASDTDLVKLKSVIAGMEVAGTD